MPAVGKTFRIFVSSTFSDLVEERNALQASVFPALRELCRQHGCRFQAIDLRWGVREEAGLDQRTMSICLGEIERCQKITPRPNFVVLLGDRYGWRPLPPEIPADEYEKVLRAVPDPEEKRLVDSWYARDDNAVPPVHVLRPRKIEAAPDAGDGERSRAAAEEARTWRGVEGRLRRILSKAALSADLRPDRLTKYFASATEQEIEAGALKAAGADRHVFGFFRAIEGLPRDGRASAYIDLDDAGAADANARERLEGLKGRLRGRLGENVHDYKAAWQGESVSKDHIPVLCADVLRRLGGVILEQIQQMAETDPVDQEKADHAAFGNERAGSFLGRGPYLERIAAYLAAAGRAPLAVFGASGSGKSALMAKALGQAREEHPQAVLVARFIGATPSSSDVRALLESLCREISRAYGGDESTVPSEYKDLVEEFPRRLALAGAGRPLIVFLDALDQLSESQNAHGLLWLPSALPGHVRLVTSAAPSGGWDVLRRKIPGPEQMDLTPLDAAEGERILEKWLLDAGRTLREGQRNEVLGKFQSNGLPLYLKFAFEEARHWRSDAEKVALEPGVEGIIRQLFTRLSSETNHGKVLVERALAYLRAAKNGLSEDEMIDVLSRDEDVIRDSRKRSFFEPPEQRLPVVVWSRFSLDLEPYLNERSADGASLLGFFHRQMGEVVEAEYLAGAHKAPVHARLAAYFAVQPLFAEKDGRRSANLRKLSELPYQQTHGGLWPDVYKTLTDFEFLEAKCTYSGVIHAPEGPGGRRLHGGVYELIEDYQRALAGFPADT